MTTVTQPPVCEACSFANPVNGVNEFGLCVICAHLFAADESSPTVASVLLGMAWIGNRLRRDLVSGSES